jgi:hypothetical protein
LVEFDINRNFAWLVEVALVGLPYLSQTNAHITPGRHMGAAGLCKETKGENGSAAGLFSGAMLVIAPLCRRVS